MAGRENTRRERKMLCNNYRLILERQIHGGIKSFLLPKEVYIQGPYWRIYTEHIQIVWKAEVSTSTSAFPCQYDPWNPYRWMPFLDSHAYVKRACRGRIAVLILWKTTYFKNLSTRFWTITYRRWIGHDGFNYTCHPLYLADAKKQYGFGNINGARLVFRNSIRHWLSRRADNRLFQDSIW